MTTRTNKGVHTKRVLFAAVIAVSALIQHSSAIPEIFGARAMVLIPALVAVAMHEKSMAGLFFGALSGILWDFATVQGDGFYSAALTVIGYFICVLMTYFLRCNIFTAMILGFGACVLTLLVSWGVFIVLPGYEGAFSVLLSFYIPSAVYSAMFILPYYYLVHFIAQSTDRKF